MLLIRVHPFAAAVLKAWHDEGWKKFMDREPKPDDLIHPAQRRQRVGGWDGADSRT